jgi:hypothetical protein
MLSKARKCSEILGFGFLIPVGGLCLALGWFFFLRMKFKRQQGNLRDCMDTNFMVSAFITRKTIQMVFSGRLKTMIWSSWVHFGKKCMCPVMISL